MYKFMHVVGLLFPLSNRMFYICSDVLVGQLKSESVDYLAFAGRQFTNSSVYGGPGVLEQKPGG